MFNTIFEVSTNHIQESTDRWLVDTRGKPENPFAFDVLSNGYLFYVADYEELIEDHVGGYDFTRSELHELIAKVKGLSPYCTHVLIDIDGPEYEFLDVFDWEINEIEKIELNFAQRHAIAYQVQLGIDRGVLGSIEWSLLGTPDIEKNDIASQIMIGNTNGLQWSLDVVKAGTYTKELFETT